MSEKARQYARYEASVDVRNFPDVPTMICPTKTEALHYGLVVTGVLGGELIVYSNEIRLSGAQLGWIGMSKGAVFRWSKPHYVFSEGRWWRTRYGVRERVWPDR